MSRTIVITGASQGLGFAAASAFLERGWNVFLTAPADEQVRDALRRLDAGDQAAGLARDVALDAEPVWTAAEAAFGPPDVWFNSAGLALTGDDFIDMDLGDLERMLMTNVLGAAQGCRAALNGMKGRRGAIYNMWGAGSDGAPVPKMIGYGTSKAAVTFLTRSLAKEVEGTDILVGGISPGLVMTEGFFREHARTPPEALESREKVVNFLGDHPETSARWIYRCIASNRRNGAEFIWLNSRRLAARRQGLERRPRDILSAYRGGAQ